MEGQIRYYCFLGFAAAAAAAFFVVSLFRNKFEGKIKICLLCGISLFVSLLVCGLLNIIVFVTPISSPFTDFEYYITMLVFVILTFSALKLFKISDENQRKILNDIIIKSLIIFSFISRFGCLFAGCCTGKSFNGFVFPNVIIELVFAAACLVIVQFVRIKDKTAFYLFSYSVFRLITEFLRNNYGVREILYLNFRQYIAAVVIVYYIVGYGLKLLERKGGLQKYDEKN